MGLGFGGVAKEDVDWKGGYEDPDGLHKPDDREFERVLFEFRHAFVFCFGYSKKCDKKES